MIIIAVIALIITMMSIANVWASEATDYEARQVCGPPKLEPPQVFPDSLCASSSKSLHRFSRESVFLPAQDMFGRIADSTPRLISKAYFELCIDLSMSQFIHRTIILYQQ